MASEPEETGRSLYRHLKEVGRIVAGSVHFGDDAALEVVYDGERFASRDKALRADQEALAAAGYRTNIVGRNAALGISLTNIGTPFAARFVK